MMPSNDKFPNFVADQLLTKEDLNNMFSFLDEQERLTRVNLIGAGIACGLEVSAAADGSSVSISRGTGVTSEGYLATLDDITYSRYLPYDAVQKEYYDPFVSSLLIQKFPLWELKEKASDPGTSPLTLPFLTGNGKDEDSKVVVLFVELYLDQNKNCDPASCDDKGETVNVNLRPLLVRKTDVGALTAGKGGNWINTDYAGLKETRLPRFDVPFRDIVTGADLLGAFKSLLPKDFIEKVQAMLTSAWTLFKPVVGAQYPDNPFKNLGDRFAFLYGSSLTATHLRELQYHCDYFGDLLAAFREFRQAGLDVLSACCPDSSLFPRHLLLDLAVHGATDAHSAYRHYWTPSPLFQRRDLIDRLRSLFHRLVLMQKRYQIPESAGSTANPDPQIRITPSLLSDAPLSAKAIPYYFDAAHPATDALLNVWNFGKTQIGQAEQILSYHADEYAKEDFAANPLKYDLEPYNFLRIEGHLGKTYGHALNDLKKKVKRFRLPIDVIALSLGNDGTGTEPLDPMQLGEIQMQFETLRTEVICCLRKQMSYWGALQPKEVVGGKVKAASMKMVEEMMVAPEAAPKTAPKAAPASVRMEAAVKPSDSQSAAMAAKLAYVQKGDLAKSVLGAAQEGLVKEYLQFQAKGDFDLSRIPDPEPVFSPSVITHYALIIMDEMEEIARLLSVDSVLSLDVDALKTHSDGLTGVSQKLADIVAKQIDAPDPVNRIRTYVNESEKPIVDSIASVVPGMTLDTSNKVIVLLRNLNEEDKGNLVGQLIRDRASSPNQMKIIDGYYGKLASAGTASPSLYDSAIRDAAALKELLQRLRNSNCLCSLESFLRLRQLILQAVASMRDANLFSNFVGKHPGIQHKAGAPAGGTFILVYNRHGAKGKLPVDASVVKGMEGIGDGVVIADFYLPYLIASHLQPIQYQVTEGTPPPEKVTLELEPNNKTSTLSFSAGDPKTYAFSHSPGNGTFNNGSAANGVQQPSADVFTFTPGAVALGNAVRKDLLFSYTKLGVKSDDLKVSVLALPTAAISAGSLKTEQVPGNPITLVATVQNADKFAWSMQDSQGVVTQVGTGKDLPGFILKDEGAFTFRLSALQSETGTEAPSNSVTFTVKKPEAPKQTCGSLAGIQSGFAALKAREEFAAFEKNILSKLGITAYFASLGKLLAQPEDQQIEFFRSGKEGTTLNSRLAVWSATLLEVVDGGAESGFRLSALEMYRIGLNLAMYAACIGKTDLTKADTPLFTAFVNQLHAKDKLGILDLLPNMNAAEKASVHRLGQDVSEEARRQAVNQKILAKPVYARALAKLESLLEKV